MSGQSVRTTSLLCLFYRCGVASQALGRDFAAASSCMRETADYQRIDYIHLGGKLVAQRSRPMNYNTATVTYHHTDHIGSANAETNAAGSQTRRIIRMPYGSPYDGFYREGAGYAGHVTDTQTNLTYMQQRYYDPVALRFLSPDPVDVSASDGGNFNRYWYANNNPYKFTDPDGREVRFAIKSSGAAIDAMRMGVYLAKSPTAKTEFNQIAQSDTRYVIQLAQSGGSGGYNMRDKVIRIYTREGLMIESSGEIQSPAIGGIHEISHAAENDRVGDQQSRKNAWLAGPTILTPTPRASPEEERAVGVESKVMNEVGESARRESYYDVSQENIITCGPTSTTKC